VLPTYHQSNTLKKKNLCRSDGFLEFQCSQICHYEMLQSVFEIMQNFETTELSYVTKQLMMMMMILQW